MLLACLLGGGVDWHQDLLCAPVEFHVVVATERKYHGTNRRRFPFAHVVEVQHTLNSSILQAIHDRPRLRRRRHDGMFVAIRRRLLWSCLVLHLDSLPCWRRCRSSIEIRLRQSFFQTKCHWHNRSDVSLRTIDLDAQSKFLTRNLQFLQALQVVGSSTAAPNLNLVLLDLIGKHVQGLDETREGGRNICEVRDASPDDQELALWVFVSAHQGQDGLGIGECLLGAGSP
mmetsp:Transcript_86055/g.136709  ORF Transcript_86055/g.136709 Transcript_86055/m.136709 type:complete len:229 (-) Transcript_86055:382-1068(-)